MSALVNARILKTVRLGLKPDATWAEIDMVDNDQHREELAYKRAFNGHKTSRALTKEEILYWVNEYPIEQYVEIHKLYNATLGEIIIHMKVGLGVSI